MLATQLKGKQTVQDLISYNVTGDITVHS